MYILVFIIIMLLSFILVAAITHCISDTKDTFLNEDWSEVMFFSCVITIASYVLLTAITDKDISAKLISQNKISAQFEIKSSKFWGLIRDVEVENIGKFTTSTQIDKLEYNDRYFRTMQLAGQDVSKYADIVNNEVMYRMTPLQEIEEK